MPDWRYDFRPRSDDTKKRQLDFTSGGSLNQRDMKNWGVILLLCVAFLFILAIGFCEVVK